MMNAVPKQKQCDRQLLHLDRHLTVADCLLRLDDPGGRRHDPIDSPSQYHSTFRVFLPADHGHQLFGLARFLRHPWRRPHGFGAPPPGLEWPQLHCAL
jgi:hypothetical protein